VSQYQLNKSIDKLVKVPEGYTKVEPRSPREMATVEVAKGVYRVNLSSGATSLFVEFDDHLIMVGGVTGVSQRMAEIKKVLPSKPVESIIITHHHSDHILGSQDAR